MLFSLSNALAIFQGYINKILAKKLNVFIIVYWDDILIYTKDLSQFHIKIVCEVLDQFRKYFFLANLKKYCFYQDKVYFLEYMVSSKDISMKAIKIKGVKD